MLLIAAFGLTFFAPNLIGSIANPVFRGFQSLRRLLLIAGFKIANSADKLLLIFLVPVHSVCFLRRDGPPGPCIE